MIAPAVSGTTSDIDRPVFIVGPHRSGTTLLYEILSEHPDVGYFNRGDHRFPQSPRFARWLTRFGWSDEPLEAQRVWDQHWRGDDDVMTAADATDEVVRWYRQRVLRTLRLRGASRFLAKYPRLSFRVEWLEATFPGAIYVHMLRDWRAVVNSTVARKVKRDARGGGWFGVRMPGWREMGDLPHEVAAGRQFRASTESLEGQRESLEGRFVNVRYSELCGDPIGVIRKLCDECQLAWSPSFEATIPTDLRCSDYKWRERLDPAMIEQVRAEAPTFFARHEEATASR